MVRQIVVALLTLSIAVPGLADSIRSVKSPFEFSSLSHSQQLAKRWEDLSDREKQRVREAKEKYDRLPPERKENLRKKWEQMPKQEKEKYRLDNGRGDRKSR